MKAMQAIQPKLKAMQEKYKNDRQKVSQETMRLYRENGVNPLGCLGPMFIQFPIWIGLYQAIIQTLPSTPERLATLSNKLYWWLPSVHKAVPLNGDFFGLDLAVPDPTRIVLPVLVGVSMFVMQKMTTMPSTSPQQDSTNRMMLWMMPVMFGFFTIQFPSGLAIYWIVSNIVGIIIQGFATGWDPLLKILNFQVVSQPSAVTANAIAGNEEVENEEEYDSDDGEDRRRRNRAGSKATRRKSRRSRNRRN
jgi:YidC/Oxa1 family membrane protein insertase